MKNNHEGYECIICCGTGRNQHNDEWGFKVGDVCFVCKGKGRVPIPLNERGRSRLSFRYNNKMIYNSNQRSES